MIYVCPTWEFAADTHLLKCQRLQNKFLRTIGHFPRLTQVRNLHVAFKIPYFMISSQNYAGSKQKSYEIIIIQIFVILDKVKPNTGNIRGLNLATVKPTTVQVTKLSL
jgi:hypothetical protein